MKDTVGISFVGLELINGTSTHMAQASYTKYAQKHHQTIITAVPTEARLYRSTISSFVKRMQPLDTA